MPKPSVVQIAGAKDARAAHILARSFFRDMRSNGYSCKQILALATELIDQVTREMRGEVQETPSSVNSDLPGSWGPPGFQRPLAPLIEVKRRAPGG
jgi:hypothetical protein